MATHHSYFAAAAPFVQNNDAKQYTSTVSVFLLVIEKKLVSFCVARIRL
jgi:hypothetical protein